MNTLLSIISSLILLVFTAGSADAARMYALVQLDAGKQLPFAYSEYHGHVRCGKIIGQYGLFLFSGTAAQLTALNARADVWAIGVRTDTAAVRWVEGDTVIPTAARNRINNWLTARGYPTIPVGWTYKQVLIAIGNRFHPTWAEDWDKHWIAEPE